VGGVVQGVAMQDDSETNQLLREMRDVMVQQHEKYKEYLEASDRATENYFQRHQQMLQHESFNRWSYAFVVICAAVSLALWLTGANK
jgi:hypothetical protein